jgi:hypothetical protein
MKMLVSLFKSHEFQDGNGRASVQARTLPNTQFRATAHVATVELALI